ncbi:hypothetical protein ACFL1B_04260 [Nanoarchaeota archaeon]
MVNLHIELPDNLHKQLRLDSVVQDTTLKDLVIKLLSEEIDSK